ncbi:TonB-dependent receptor [Proteiniphilum sp. X52]|uniref:SusC/RagA family TonB-linked outer membrane protein n=1 Tax=Proteiniphilum sp. X52 TaxID=2382159 RepID=UPI000F0A639E|nr:TonB-dependent receptor [Proteiniphilum sp. X52]RNC65967.1 TonB-dependent receptor [Proteiniphilum sp. X52]
MRRKIFNLKLGILSTLLFTFSFFAFSQNITVKGNVVDSSGEALIGVTVQVQGTASGTITDIEGNFSIPNVPPNATLEVSYVGMRTETVPVNGRTSIDIILSEDTELLDELVVVGYGTMRKSDVTGALAVVSAKELSAKPVTNAFEALQGKVAGLDITSAQRPGELGTIRIRGNRSLNATNDPLYVVDGVVLSAGGIESINPRDIESINVLKDASSTAIYGSRGANGVILVTTKRGREGSLQLNYSGTFTFENIHDLAPTMNASEYITWRRWAHHNANPSEYTPGNQPSKAQDEIFFGSLDQTSYNNVMKGWTNGSWDGSRVTNTDWTDFVTQAGITQEHTISARGGTDKIKSFFSLGYLNNEGTQKGQSYNRYNATMSTDINPTKWFSIGGSINTSWSNQSYGFSRTGQSSNSGPTEIYAAAKQIFNMALPYDDNEEIVLTPGNLNGVYTVIDEWKKSDEQRQTLRALGSFYANINLGEIWKPLEGLNFKTNFGPDFRYYRRGIYIDKTSAVRQGGTSYASWNYDRRFAWVLDNIVTYNKKMKDHSFDLTLLQSASKNDREEASMSAENIPKSSFKWNNMGSVDITSSDARASMGSNLVQSQLASYMGRINYSFRDKYLLTISGRYDGSSVLAAGHKWAFFPSAALGWRMDQESFMQNITWLEQLKLRLGMGMTGNSAVNPYDTLGNIRSFYVPFGSTGNVLAYGTNEPYYFSSATLMANPLLEWEKTTQWNFGIDFTFLKGRIGGAIDLYQSDTKDLLMRMTIPTLTGYNEMMANVGKTKNRGFDISLNFVPVQTRDFNWNSTLNLAWQKEEIVELANGKNDMVDNSWFIGQSISVYYGYEHAGLWQEEDAVEMAKFNEKGEKFTAGSVRPVDQNGDYVIGSEDRVVLGNRNPRWTTGWGNTFNYKGLELNIELYGRMNYWVSTGGETQNGIPNQRKINYWTPENRNAEWQKPVYTGTPGVGGDAYSSLLGFKKAAFIKFRNISLGYFLPRNICEPIGISSLKVFTQLRNPGNLYSSIDFLDLDYGTSTYYNRGITLGVEIGF